LKQNQDSYVLKNLEKKQNKLRVQREKKQINKQTRKIQNFFHLIVNQETKMT